jgi:hypothetical protein
MWEREWGYTVVRTNKSKFYIKNLDVLCLYRDITLSDNCWLSLPIAFLIIFLQSNPLTTHCTVEPKQEVTTNRCQVKWLHVLF